MKLHRSRVVAHDGKLLALTIFISLIMSAVPMVSSEDASAQDEDLNVTGWVIGCPPGFDPVFFSTYQIAMAECLVPQTGTIFATAVYSDESSTSTAIESAELGADGSYAFPPIAKSFQSLVLEFQTPAGYDAPNVWCESDGSGFISRFPDGRVPVPDTGIPGDSLVCVWFYSQFASEAATEPDDAQLPGSITIKKWVCNDPLPEQFASPGTFPPFDPASAGCGEANPGFGFNFNSGEHLATTDMNGQAEWPDSYTGQPIQIREIPGYYDDFQFEPIVYCGVVPAESVAASTYSGGPLAPGVAYEWAPTEYAAGDSLDCYWVNHAPTGLKNLKFVCPSDAPNDWLTESFLTMRQMCYPLSGHQFIVSDESGDLGQGGSPYFFTQDSLLSPGEKTIQVRESLPAEYATARVFCSGYASGVPFGAFQEAQVEHTNGTISITGFLEGYGQYSCLWFNLRALDDQPVAGDLTPTSTHTVSPDATATATPTIDPDAAEFGEVYVTKYLCPPGTDLDSYASDLDRRAACNQRMAGIDFELQTIPPTFGVTGNTSSTGVATWQEIPAGTVTVEELGFPGYQTLGVYCATEVEGGEPSGYQKVGDPGAANIQYELQAGYLIACDWYNVSTEGDVDEAGTISIQKWLCDDTYPDAGAPLIDWYAACDRAHTEMSFYVSYDGVTGSIETTDGNGRATLERLPGEARLYEMYVPEYLAVNAYCEIRDPGQDPVGPVYDEATSGELGNAPTGADPSIDMGGYDMPHAFHCDWFNAPVNGAVDGVIANEVADEEDAAAFAGGYGNVYVAKYLCPAGYDTSSSSRDDFAANCTEPQGGLKFQIGASGDYLSTKLTDLNGRAAWPNVPAGPVSLYEEPPYGYQLVQVYCGEDQINGGIDPEDWPSGGYQDGMALELQSGYFIMCEFYNVPVEYEGGTVLVSKYLCPPGYGLENGLGLSDYQQYCSTAHPGQRIRIT